MNEEPRLKGKYEGLLDRCSEAAEAYSSLVPVRAAIALIPVYGGAIDVLLSGGASRIVNKRVNEMLQTLAVQLIGLDESKVDKDYLMSEEFLDLLFQSFDATAKSRSQLKREDIAGLIKSAGLHQDRTRHSPEDYLYVIDRLTEPDLRILHFFYERNYSSGILPDVTATEHHRKQYAEKLGLTIEQAVFHRNKLVSEGLMNGAYSSRFHPTPFLKSLMTYIMDGPVVGP